MKLTLLVALSLLSLTAMANTSSYHDISDKNCKTIFSAPDNGDYALDACGTIEDKQVIVSYGDGRSHLELHSEDGKIEEVTPAIGFEMGAFAYLASNKIELRKKDAKSKPFALIARFATTHLETNKPQSHLAVYSLSKECRIGVINVVPGNNANIQARVLADRSQVVDLPCME